MEEQRLNSEPENLVALFCDSYGEKPTSIARLRGAGSNRQYYRLAKSNGFTCIGVIGTSLAENEAFCNMAKIFHEQGLSVPQVYAIGKNYSCYLQEDLGGTSLFDYIKGGRKTGDFDTTQESMLHAVMSELPKIQMESNVNTVYAHCFPLAEMDAQSIHFDLNYFKYCFLKLSGLEFNELRLEKDFNAFCQHLLDTKPLGFQYRDFQARNVMIKGEKPFYIDFQGGRKGPVLYDVASFLWQASAHYSPALRSKLLDTYLHALSQYVDIDRQQIQQDLQSIVLFRCLQVLGAYGFRGLWEGKIHFLESIPAGLNNLRDILRTGTCDIYPYLKEICEDLIDKFCIPQESHTAQLLAQDEKNYLATAEETSCKAPLIVDIISFSYKRGIPNDESGNGGGYVFDCRSTHNPGRFDEFRALTGLDAPVRKFLEEDGEILNYLKSVTKLADFHVRRFCQRGFTHLQFAFGCTGGQHRSVYCAQFLAEHLHQNFGIEIHLLHRELNKKTILK